MKDLIQALRRTRTSHVFRIVTLSLLLFVTTALGQAFPDVCKTPSRTMNGVTLEIRCVLKASYPVKVKITGPIRGEGHQLMTVPAGKDQKARATNPGSSFNLRGGERSVSMQAPYPPGDYELLYVTPGRQSILLSVPFRVVAPKAEILAPETAKAGETIEVRVEGEISPHTKINIVPVDSPSTLVGDHAYLSPDLNREVIPIKDGQDRITGPDPLPRSNVKPPEIPVKDGQDRITGPDPLPRSEPLPGAERKVQPSQPCYGCSTLTVQVPLRLAKPGKYEIQYVTSTSHVVYARRPLTIR